MSKTGKTQVVEIGIDEKTNLKYAFITWVTSDKEE